MSIPAALRERRIEAQASSIGITGTQLTQAVIGAFEGWGIRWPWRLLPAPIRWRVFELLGTRYARFYIARLLDDDKAMSAAEAEGFVAEVFGGIDA
jgi:hypothetical protein